MLCSLLMPACKSWERSHSLLAHVHFWYSVRLKPGLVSLLYCSDLQIWDTSRLPYVMQVTNLSQIRILQNRQSCCKVVPGWDGLRLLPRHNQLISGRRVLQGCAVTSVLRHSSPDGDIFHQMPPNTNQTISRINTESLAGSSQQFEAQIIVRWTQRKKPF